jgi:uncharacterized membrane protein
MTSTAIALVLLSAVLHSLWNLASKKVAGTLPLFAWANVVGAVLLVPVVFVYRNAFFNWPPAVGWLLVVTGFFQVVYFAGLSRAYRTGDLGVVYPLARALPVLLVAVASSFLGSQAPMSADAVAGVALVVGGCLLLPLQRWKDGYPSRYRSAAGGFAFVAACGTTGYTLVDSEGLRLLREGFPGLLPWETSLCYLFGEALSSASWLSACGFALGRGEMMRSWRERKGTAVFVGAASYVTYGLVLWAMNHVSNVSYVVALRQASIVISVGLGILVLGERAYLPRVSGALGVVAGLVLVALS